MAKFFGEVERGTEKKFGGPRAARYNQHSGMANIQV